MRYYRCVSGREGDVRDNELDLQETRRGNTLGKSVYIDKGGPDVSMMKHCVNGSRPRRRAWSTRSRFLLEIPRTSSRTIQVRHPRAPSHAEMLMLHSARAETLLADASRISWTCIWKPQSISCTIASSLVLHRLSVVRITPERPCLIQQRMPSTNKRKQPQFTGIQASRTSPVASKLPSKGFTYAEGTHVSKKRRVASNGAELAAAVQEDVGETVTNPDNGSIATPMNPNAGGDLFNMGSAAAPGNPFSGLASASNGGTDDGGFEKVMSKEEKRKDKKRKREEKLKLVRWFLPRMCFALMVYCTG